MSSSQSPSGASTPNPRFTSQQQTAEDLLKEQTVGLVHLSDFRKRRVEALELAQDGAPSGTSTPESGREQTPKAAAFKKRKKDVKKGGLSFADDDENSENDAAISSVARSATRAKDAAPAGTDSDVPSDTTLIIKKRLKPSASVAFQAKAQTKSSLAREAQLKESLRKQYLQLQEAVKATEFVLPFVFFDGKNTPGGKVRVKKGDFVWLFLERARKVGAETAGTGAVNSRRDWARIGVDDLIIVRGEIIIPHHYDFHHFILNRSVGYNGTLFPYSSEPTQATPTQLLPTNNSTPELASESTPETLSATTPAVTTAADRNAPPAIPDSALEGFSDDPALTRVVDRRWYEKNKHIYPASLWEEFDPERDYTAGGRKDKDGNFLFR